jgi:adenosylcobyric acid synthase
MRQTHRARALMLQATASHAGKTVLTAGLCRLLVRRGLRVVPFKAQNMSLNSWVAEGGGEIGWAQAMQAEAACVAPRVEMNPILLKPRADDRSQLVVLGKATGEVGAREYYRRGAALWPVIRSSYEALARDAEVVVIEGAGSPAEPNLMARDLANMRVARMARAPVVVVGDIDRGGVFASLVGTMALLPPADRKRVAGFVINKFRGDVRLLRPAISDLERRTDRKVLGVVPFLFRLRLADEDSVGLDAPPPDRERLAVAVVRLPHIANFTDFAPLENEPDVRLSYAHEPRDLAAADLVVLPGSKDTIADLRFVKARGFGPALAVHAAGGGAVLGVCGGYQMLGRAVADPHGVESGGTEEGLGLLPVNTVLERRKTTRRVTARWLPDGPTFHAYEIHMGLTRPAAACRSLWRVGGAAEGCVDSSGRILGTYLHGLFDSGAARRRLVEWARAARRDASRAAPADARATRDAEYDRLADVLSAALRPSALDELLGL